MNSNYEKYPNIFAKPQEINVMEEDKCTLYQLNFNGLTEIRDYLLSNPEINTEVFTKLIRNTNDNGSFFGNSYEGALNNLVEKSEVKKEIIDSINTLASRVDEKLITELDSENKTVDINVDLNYNITDTERTMLNRAIILASVTKALEDNGYKVRLNGISLSKSVSGVEMININVKLKEYDEKLDLPTLFKALCTKSFPRRILLSVMETIDVKGYRWGDTYGISCTENDLNRVVPRNYTTLYFGKADDLSINGDILERDFNECVSKLLEYIDIAKIFEICKEKYGYNTFEDDSLYNARKK